MEKTLSIVIPAYNEEKTISEILKKVLKSRISIKKEIIVVNDGSNDNTQKIVEKWITDNKGVNAKLLNKKNGGKGSAIKLGIKNAGGDIIIVQDADLEYDPNDYQELIKPILEGKYKVVYGSRRLNKKNKLSGLSFYLGGRVVTLITNMLFFSRLTDEPTCYKVFDKELIKSIHIEGDKFEWEPEVTAKILKRGYKIGEVPIRYYPRSIDEGKKIRWRDGVDAIWTLIKWRFKSE